jgi:hypothetical protein
MTAVRPLSKHLHLNPYDVKTVLRGPWLVTPWLEESAMTTDVVAVLRKTDLLRSVPAEDKHPAERQRRAARLRTTRLELRCRTGP